jgi:very-short-patch-repair endonuclease
MNPELRDVAATHDGLFTTAEALAAGHDAWGLLRLVECRAVVHLARGLYAVAPASPLSAEEAHRRLARGGLLLYDDAVLAGHSALATRGLPVWGANLGRAHLLRPVKREVLTERFVFRPMCALLDHLDMEERCARLPLALVQHTLEHGAVPGVVAADAALHRGLVSMDGLGWACEVVKGWPRSSRVRSMLAHVDERSESVGESRLRFGLAVAGIAVVPQVVIEDRRGRFVARVDFLVEGTNIVIEFDGKVKYRDGGAEALMSEKRREDSLRRLGYVVIRVTWADLERMPMVVGWIRREMTASRDKVVLRPTTQAG